MKRKNSLHSASGDRRRRIIQAALDCFTEMGYTDTGMAHICQRSGASIGSMYHHFRSKEQLAAAVYMEGIVQYQAGLLEALRRGEGAQAGVRAVIGFHLRWVAENPDWARFLFRMRHESFMTGTDDEFLRLNREFTGEIARWFVGHVQAGTVRRMAWDMYVAILLGPCQEFARVFLTGKAVSSVDEAVEELSRTAWISLAVHP